MIFDQIYGAQIGLIKNILAWNNVKAFQNAGKVLIAKVQNYTVFYFDSLKIALILTSQKYFFTYRSASAEATKAIARTKMNFIFEAFFSF